MTPFRRPFLRPLSFLLVPLTLATGARSAPSFAADLPPASVEDRATLQDDARDYDAEELPGGFILMTPKRFAPPTPVVNSRFGWRFSRVAVLYAARRDDRPGLARRVIIHFEPDEREKAVRVARLYARLLRLHHQRTWREAIFRRDADCADVWLCEDKPERTPNYGGETRDKDVYIYSVGSERTTVEWTRTLVHEWGHLTLSAARGFTDPETDAAGYLGERLYMKWLREEAAALSPQAAAAAAKYDDGVTAADLDTYYRRQIAPLIGRFHEAGPQSPVLAQTGQAAMDLYIGAVLASDDAFGARLTGDALFTVQGVRPRDFLEAQARILKRVPALTVRLPAWIPLSQGRYSVATPASGGGGTIAIADRPSLRVAPARPAPLRVVGTGWKWARKTGGAVFVITLRRP